jgi:hypothetical protein
MSFEHLIQYGESGAAINPDQPQGKKGPQSTPIIMIAGGGSAWPIGNSPSGVHTDPMSDMNREEVKSRLEASEARVATAVEGMRADNAALRADLQTGIKAIEAQGQVMRAEAASFFSDARRVLAEIQVSQEKDRNQYYALGYKVIVWSIGTVLTVTGLGLGLWNAIHKAPPPSPAPAPAAAVQQATPAPSPPVSKR